MSLWKVQKFFGDLFYDLRSRNLLPIVIMLAVGILAVPILISSSSSSGSGSVSLGPSAASLSSPEAENAVVAYHPPGIRNLKSRLNDLSAKNPFIQQFTGGGAKASGSSSTTVSGVVPNSGSIPGLNGVGTNTGSGNGGSGGSGGSSGGGGGNGGGGGKTQTVYSYYQTDVTIGEAGGTPVAAHNLKQFQFLPSPDKPALVYLGTTSSGNQALFMVSRDVPSVGGNGVCYPSADACQLLGLGAGAGADFYYSPNGKTYHVQVTKIKHVTSSKPPS